MVIEYHPISLHAAISDVSAIITWAGRLVTLNIIPALSRSVADKCSCAYTSIDECYGYLSSLASASVALLGPSANFPKVISCGDC